MSENEEEVTYQNFEQEDDSVASSKAVNQGRPISVESQNKIVRLFTYLEKALSLDDSVTRDFLTTTTQPSPWWLADYPRDVENLHIRDFDTEKNIDEDTKSNIWISVEKKNIKSAPVLLLYFFQKAIDFSVFHVPIFHHPTF